MSRIRCPLRGKSSIRVTAVGLCGSDLHWFATGGIGDATLTAPLVLGHEIAGEIADGPRRGTRVAVDPADPCGICDLCAAGRGHLCPTLRFAGHGTTDGGLRSLMAWPARLLHPLPDGIADDEAALLEPLGVAHPCSRSRRRPAGMGVAVHGCGPIGLMLVQLLRGWAPMPFSPAIASSIGSRLPGSTARRMPARRPCRHPPSSVDVAFEVAGEDFGRRVRDRHRSTGGSRHPGRHSRARPHVVPGGCRTRKELTLQLCRRMTAGDLPRAIDLVMRNRVELWPRSRLAPARGRGRRIRCGSRAQRPQDDHPAGNVMTDRPAPDCRRHRCAADLLAAGEVVAFRPTRSTALAWPRRAQRVEALFALKHRPLDRRIPILVADLAQATAAGWLADERAHRLAGAFWPGALTIVLPAADGGETQAFRAPDHPLALELIRLAGPILATSANRSDEPDTLGADEVLIAFATQQDELAAVVDGGPVPGGVASTVAGPVGLSGSGASRRTDHARGPRRNSWRSGTRCVSREALSMPRRGRRRLLRPLRDIFTTL